MFDVGAASLDLALTALAVAMVLIGMLSLWPWRLRDGRNRWTLALPLVALAAFAAYEILMPDSFDIRIDLLVIVPLLVLILVLGIGRGLYLRIRRRRGGS